jgi:hypothetical protein
MPTSSGSAQELLTLCIGPWLHQACLVGTSEYGAEAQRPAALRDAPHLASSGCVAPSSYCHMKPLNHVMLSIAPMQHLLHSIRHQAVTWPSCGCTEQVCIINAQLSCIATCRLGVVHISSQSTACARLEHFQFATAIL